MFQITEAKGFTMTFENGVTVSVQWGHSNYCANHKSQEFHPSVMTSITDISSPTAEVAVWRDDGCDCIDWITKEYDGDDRVISYASADDVARIIAWASSLPA